MKLINLLVTGCWLCGAILNGPLAAAHRALACELLVDVCSANTVGPVLLTLAQRGADICHSPRTNWTLKVPLGTNVGWNSWLSDMLAGDFGVWKLWFFTHFSLPGTVKYIYINIIYIYIKTRTSARVKKKGKQFIKWKHSSPVVQPPSPPLWF